MAYFKKILLVKAIGFGFRIVALEGYSVNNWVSNTKMCPTLFWTSLGNFLGWFFFFAPSFFLGGRGQGESAGRCYDIKCSILYI
jgi:hypothetical protein